MANRATPAQLLAIAVLAASTLLACVRRQALLDDASQSRLEGYECRLRRARLDLLTEQARVQTARTELRVSLAARLVQARRDRLSMLLRQLDARQRQALAVRSGARFSEPSSALLLRTSWHAVAPDGTCPAPLPMWDWRILLRAALATRSVERRAALEVLRQSSRLPLEELHNLADRYSQVLANREFEGILEVDHPPCEGRRFAWLEGDRMLTIDCPRGEARYAIDEHAELYEYIRPVRMSTGEAFLAYCDGELNLLLHPKLKPELLPGYTPTPSPAKSAAEMEHARLFSGDDFLSIPQLPQPAEIFVRVQPPEGRRVPSVLVFMIDATSRAHFRRSLPKTLKVLERMARDEVPPGSGASSPPLHVFDFHHFNIVGYNSVPNQLPLYCNIHPDDIFSMQPGRCVWEVFKQRGAVTMLADEVHDNCRAPTSVLHALLTSAFWISDNDMPHHQMWKIFCSPHVAPCCWATRGFLNPGRRQCVGGDREMHDVLISYLEQWLAMYSTVPRRFASVNTMVAHEHFMLRLPALDEALSSLLERLEATTLQDTVLFLLSDHGTHGIWYNDYEIGAVEHKLPLLYVVAPDWLMKERPEWLAALHDNQRRLVTVREVYAAMLQLAAFPDAHSLEKGLRSLFETLPEQRSCAEAGIPEEFCACHRVT